jgi:penicillin-binding protein 1A
VSDADTESAWKQHFPTYHFEDRDIALEEYRQTAKTLEAEERVFLNAANISIVIGAAFGSLALGRLKALTESLSPQVPAVVTLAVVLGIAMSAGAVLLRYFADRQKAMVFAGRKVIVLRRMLGMSYGRLQLVLPNWRIEGADEPFALRLFPGWNTYVAYPCYAIGGISSVVVFFVGTHLLSEPLLSTRIATFLHPLSLAVSLAAVWFICLCWLYRKALLDTHERTLLLVAQGVAKLLGIAIEDRAEYVIYRANLAVHELHRHKIELSELKRMAVQIEDKEFFSHRGTSWRGMARMVLSILRLGPRSGGSTITQQLARTLFIIDQSKLVRRKLVEILLALWISAIMTKDRQLEMYLASVRFDYGVMGLAAAQAHFFGGLKKQVSRAEAFFLIERLSNIRSQVLGSKIAQTLRRAIDDRAISVQDAVMVVAIYRQLVDRGTILDKEARALTSLEREWPATQRSTPADV